MGPGCRAIRRITGVHEALELRDGDKKRYGGKGVLKAVANVNDVVSDALYGWDATEQKSIDAELLSLDGTQNKSKLGAKRHSGRQPGRCQGRGQFAGPALYRYIGGVHAHVCRCR